MDPLQTYDYLVRARQRVFDWVRPLDAPAYAREFPIGLGTLGRTLAHILSSEWYYVQRMAGRPVPPYDQWPIRHETPIVTASPAEIFTQLAFHEVHHRAQATAMLRQLGVAIEDLDFNSMTYRRRRA